MRSKLLKRCASVSWSDPLCSGSPGSAHPAGPQRWYPCLSLAGPDDAALGLLVGGQLGVPAAGSAHAQPLRTMASPMLCWPTQHSATVRPQQPRSRVRHVSLPPARMAVIPSVALVLIVLGRGVAQQPDVLAVDDMDRDEGGAWCSNRPETAHGINGLPEGETG
jgi:hypothetical protein